MRTHTRLAALAAGVLLTGLAMPFAVAAPAAPSAVAGNCKVNGNPAEPVNGKIWGTERDDRIRCTDARGVSFIYGLGGNDGIYIDGDLNQTIIQAGDGQDGVTVLGKISGTYEHPGGVYGEGDRDIIRVDYVNVHGVVSSGEGPDQLYVRTVQHGHVLGDGGDDAIDIDDVGFSSVVHGGPGNDVFGGDHHRAFVSFPSSFVFGDEGWDTCTYRPLGKNNEGSVDCEVINGV